MKKIIIIILILLLVAPVFARTFTEEEFYEVYDALQESTELLKQADETISSLNEQVNSLTESNEKMIEQLKSAKSELEDVYKLLEKAEKELKNSNKIIEKLNNQRILIGGSALLRTDFASVPTFGFKFNAGYKVWLGYVSGEFSVFNDKSMIFGVSYNLVF